MLHLSDCQIEKSCDLDSALRVVSSELLLLLLLLYVGLEVVCFCFILTRYQPVISIEKKKKLRLVGFTVISKRGKTPPPNKTLEDNLRIYFYKNAATARLPLVFFFFFF